MNWVLILFYVANGAVGTTEISDLSKKGCAEQAIMIMESGLPVLGVCVEKR